ncbi:WXG100 family type VII secretion target [Plantactinospora sp. GCM10030261]|uniref:WXG100 family type VII secretion target n=1 Tax=Plantactinospora sp. GCM10030261 TaxID=3273420 RepID=UPI0036140195
MGNGYSYNTSTSEITYNFGSIADVATAIGTYQGTMNGSLQDLYNDFKKLIGENWSGTAAEACDEARTKWNQGATEIEQALGRLGVKLGASADRMQQIDNQVASSF